MKKNRLAAGALAFAVSVTACGCGEKVYEMTNEEEAAVVYYSAHAVTKFNKRRFRKTEAGRKGAKGSSKGAGG